MIFKNTFKLLFSNFALTYKVLIHKLIAMLLAFGIAGTIGTPFLMHLTETQFFTYILNQLVLMFENINLGNIFICFKNIFLEIIVIFKSLDISLLFNALISIFAFFAIFGLFGGISELAVIDSLNSNLSSKTRLSYFKSLISKTFKSFLMSIIKFFICIPYFVCVLLIFYFGFISFDIYGDLFKILIPICMFLAFVLVTGMHLTILAGFAPSIIVNDEGVFKGLIIGFNSIKKKFFKVLSTSVMLVFILTLTNLIVCVYSFFAGLILTIPISYLIVCLYKIIAYYESNGMRYYVGDGIRTPLRKGEQDKIKKIKYIV